MASEKVTQALELLGGLTVLELNELVETLQEEWGVTAAVAAPVAAAGGAAADGGGAAEEEKTEFDVVLKDVGAKKIQVIKAVRQVDSGLGLKEAKDLVEGAPCNVLEGASKEDAEAAKKTLEEAGATVEVK